MTLNLFAIFGLGFSHGIPSEVEIYLPDFADLLFDEVDDFNDLLPLEYDWDYLYQPGDMVEDEWGRIGTIQFLTPENENPFADDARCYYVVGLRGEFADYLLPDEIRYAL